MYWLASYLSTGLELAPDAHADLLIAAPKVTQAVFAALGDFYTWKLAERIYGRDSNEAWAAVCSFVCRKPNTDPSSVISGCKSSADDSGHGAYVLACGDCLQPLAVVLFDTDAVQLPRDHLDDCCTIPMAMGMVFAWK